MAGANQDEARLRGRWLRCLHGDDFNLQSRAERDQAQTEKRLPHALGSMNEHVGVELCSTFFLVACYYFKASSKCYIILQRMAS